MTIAAYENFLSNKEWECFLRGRIYEYARSNPMSMNERQQLLCWCLLGNDIHNNPNGWTDDSGRPMDYLHYLRTDPSACKNSQFADHQNADVCTAALSMKRGAV